jgi:cob(I)alamin adenosyltransferase
MIEIIYLNQISLILFLFMIIFNLIKNKNDLLNSYGNSK